jgi:branched-chain amino acid transport system ATP-binding protein
VGEGDRQPALLQLEGLRRAFGSVVVADDLTLSIAAGETLGIVGPNGAGKTSVLNLITGTLPVDGGRVLLDGIDITRMPAHDRARMGIGRTYQVPQPFGGMTVFENVLVGATHAAGGRVDGLDPATLSADALSRTDLLTKANRLAGRLPLLDRKRLELARALATRPRLLLLDEIAGGLTEAEVAVLLGTIRRLREEGVTIVWIEHVVHALVSVVDRLVAMSFGRKLAEGNAREVLDDPGVQAVYLGTQEATA